MDFESLPLEIKSHIFSYLSIDDLRFKVAIVSKRWQEISRDPHVVTHIEIYKWLNPKEIIQRLVTYNLIRSLKITKIFDFNWVLDIPVNNNLRRLHIDYCFFKTETLQVLSTRFPMISKLKFSHCRNLGNAILNQPDGNIRSDCLRLFSENCQRLEEVDVTAYYRGGAKTCQTLLDLHGKTLTKLKLCGIPLTDKNYSTLTQCSRITDLRLFHLYNMTDSQLLLIKKMRSLRKLTVMGAFNVSTNAIVELFTGPSFPHVHSINLLDCNQLSNDDVTLISKSYPNLKSLNLILCRKITNAGVKSILENCSILENLKLSVNCDVVEYTLTLISTTRVPYLKHLNFFDCGCKRNHSEFYREKLTTSNPGLLLNDKNNFAAKYRARDDDRDLHF